MSKLSCFNYQIRYADRSPSEETQARPSILPRLIRHLGTDKITLGRWQATNEDGRDRRLIWLNEDLPETESENANPSLAVAEVIRRRS